MANRPEIRILVTGASGFVGSHALAAFAERSLPVIAIGRNLPLQPRETETWLRADLLVRDQLKSILKDVAPTHVVHLAGGVFSSAIETIDANLTTTLNLLHCVSGSDVKFVQIGTAAEFDHTSEMPLTESSPTHPHGPYAQSKAAAVACVKEVMSGSLGTWLVIRPFNVVGCGCPGNLLPGAIRDRILVAESGSSIAVGNMEPKRDFVHVEDVAQAIVGLSVGDIGEIEVNICSGSPTCVGDFVNEMICVSGKEIELKTDPRYVRPDDIPISYGLPNLAEELTGLKFGFDVTRAAKALILNQTDIPC